MAIWKDIPGWEGFYQASNNGKIRSIDRAVKCRNGAFRKSKGKVLSGGFNRFTGYYTVMLTDGPTRKCRSIHRLVCLAFNGLPPSESHQAAHKDGDKNNNAASNLMWATGKENTSHRYKHGTILFGEDHPLSKLNNSAVMSIRELKKQGYPTARLAEKFGVSTGTILEVAVRKTWQHLP